MPLAACSILCDLQEMDLLAKNVSKKLEKGSVIALSGDLGAGKTTFTLMLARHLGIQDQMSSPTYTYLNIYDEKIAHFDLYRLKHKNEFFSMGFEEYLDSDFIIMIEWPDVIDEFLPKKTIRLHFTHKGDKREVTSNVEILL